MAKGNEGGDPKEKADVPPVLPSEQQTSSKTAGALSPEDLDFTDSPHVGEIDEGRYVVSADGRPNVPDETKPTTKSQAHSPATTDSQSSDGASDPALDVEPEPDPAAEPKPRTSTRDQHTTPQSPEAARSLLATELEHVDTRFAIDIVSRFGEDTVRHRMSSDDVIGTFNSLVYWYARHVSQRTSTNRAASLLLSKSDFTPALSPEQVQTAMREHDLDESSSIEELLDALE